MTKMLRKMVSLILSLTMLLSMIPASVMNIFAATSASGDGWYVTSSDLYLYRATISGSELISALKSLNTDYDGPYKIAYSRPTETWTEHGTEIVSDGSYTIDFAGKNNVTIYVCDDRDWNSATDCSFSFTARKTDVIKVQEQIDALDSTEITSEEIYEARVAALETVGDAIDDLETAESDYLDYTNYTAAQAAIAAWTGNNESQETLADAVPDDTDGNGWEWSGNILYIKDGDPIDLYTALTDDSGINLDPKAKTSGFPQYPAAMKIGTQAAYAETYYNTFLGEGYSWNWSSNGIDVTTSQTLTQTTYKTGYTNGEITKWSWGSDFEVMFYHEIKTAVAEGSPEGAGISVATKNVVSGDTVKITVNNIDGYTATVTDNKGGTVSNLDDYEPTESTTLTVTYTSNEVTKYKVTLVEDEDSADWGTATLRSEADLPAGKEALVEAVPNTNDDNHKYEVVSVKVGDTELSKNTNGYYVYTMGEADVTITVTFSMMKLTGNASANVKFNGYEAITVSDQMNGGGYYADVANQYCLEQAIFSALDVSYFPDGVSWNTTGVTYEYLAVNMNTTMAKVDSVWSALNVTPENDKGTTGYGDYAYYAFAYGFADGSDLTETVRVGYNGLLIEAEITLTESRGNRTVTYGAYGAESAPIEYETADALDGLIKQYVTLSGLSWDGITLSWGALPAANASGKVTVTVVGDNGDANYLPTTSFDVYIKSPEAVATVTLNITGNGTVKIGEDTYTAGTYELAPGAYTLTALLGDTDTANVDYYATIDGEKVETKNITLTADGTYTVEIVFTKKTLEQKDPTDKVKFNPKKTVDEQLNALKEYIFNAVVNSGASLPTGIKYTDLDYKYYPYYEGIVGGNVVETKYSTDNVSELTAASPDDYYSDTFKTGGTYYDFGERFSDGGAATEYVLLTGKTGTQWEGLSLTVEITLVDLRPTTVINAGNIDFEAESEADVTPAKIEEKLNGSITVNDTYDTGLTEIDWSNVEITIGEYVFLVHDEPPVEKKVDVKVTITLPETETYQGTTKEVTVTVINPAYNASVESEYEHGTLSYFTDADCTQSANPDSIVGDIYVKVVTDVGYNFNSLSLTLNGTEIDIEEII